MLGVCVCKCVRACKNVAQVLSRQASWFWAMGDVQTLKVGRYNVNPHLSGLTHTAGACLDQTLSCA